MTGVVGEARKWLGTPYRHQAATIGAGCDCLGLVRGVWRGLYGAEIAPVPPYGTDWRDPDLGTQLIDAARRYLVPVAGPPQAGHLVLFCLMRHRPPRHCAIMVGPDRFIHALEQTGVVESAYCESWQRRLAGVFAFPGEASDR